MEPDPNTALARYPLRSIALALRRFRAPTGPFDPAGAWEQTWRVCTA